MAMASRPTKRQREEQRRAAAEAAKAAMAQAARRRRFMVVGGAAVAIVAVVIVVIFVVANRPSTTPSSTAPLPTPAPAAGGGNPPWPAPSNPDANVAAAGLRLLSQEGAALHFHSHLDILVNGAPVAVPSGIGINEATQKISEMHTHDTTGVIHIEAPDTSHRYALGQLFAEWGVRLDATHLGALTTGAGKTLVAYVNGKPVQGDPARIELTPHEQLTLVYGDAGATPKVASSYSFPQGE